MKKILTIVVTEYRRQVKRRAFLGALIFPLIMIAFTGVIVLLVVSTMGNQDRGEIGYVDAAGAITKAVAEPNGSNTYRRFNDLDAGRAALAREQIIALFVLAPDFAQSGKADLYYWKNEPSRDVRRAFERFAKSAVLVDQPAQLRERLAQGASFTLQTSDGARTLDADNPVGFFVPLMFAFLFVISVFSGAQYLLQAVVDEKQNRTMEILVTSVTPNQLMTGKIVGLALVGMTQIAAWTVAAVAVALIAKPRVPFLDTVVIEPGLAFVAAVMFSMQYLLLGAMMAAIGATVVDQKDGQNAAGPFSLLAMAPLFFIGAIMIDPNGPISVVLSLVPIISPLAMTMRVALASVPAWQIALSMALMAVSVGVAFWLSGRIFRIGMLEFGKNIPLLDVVKNLRI